MLSSTQNITMSFKQHFLVLVVIILISNGIKLSGVSSMEHSNGWDFGSTTKDRALIQRTINELKAGGESASRIISRVRRSLEDKVQRNEVKLTAECYSDLVLFMKTLEEPMSPAKKYNWAHQMMDSYGGLASGIAQANFYWLGDFWECLNVKVMRNNSDQLRFRGQYCLSFVQLFVPIISIKVGTCFPSTCTYIELEDMAHAVMTFPFTLNMNPDYCQTAEMPKWDQTSVAIGAVIGVFVCLVIIATLYDGLQELKSSVSLSQTESQNRRHSNNGGCWKSILLTFSARRNWMKIMDVSTNENKDFGVIHGLRAISISWVVVGHCFLVVYSMIPFKNMAVIIDLVKQYKVQPLLSTEFSVDTFFCISGFLAAYGMLEYLSNGGKFNYPVYILHRLLRLSPAYWLFLAFMCGPYPYTGKGPVFPATLGDRDVCRDKWWKNALYINIYFDETLKCLPQAWYLCMDIVYYVILYPLIVIPLYKKPLLGQINFLVILIASFLIPGLLIYTKDLAAYPSLNVSEEQRAQYMKLVYAKPWGRMSTVLIGMAFGYLLHIKGKVVKINLLIVYLSWMIAAGVGLALVYGMQPYMAGERSMELGMQVVYGTLTRPAWGLAVGWVIYSCSTGYGGLINKLLSWKGFIPASRLAYTIYLVHFTVIGVYYGARADSTYIDFGIMAYICTSMLVLSFLFGFILNLMAEAPIIALENLIFKSGSKKGTSNGEIDDKSLRNSHQGGSIKKTE